MNKNRWIPPILHVVCWLIIFLPYIIFIYTSMEWDVCQHISRLVTPVCVAIIFYLNYLVFVPRFYIKRHYAAYILINTGMLLLSLFVIDWSSDLIFAYQHMHHAGPPMPARPAPPPPNELRKVGFLLMNLPVMIAAASMARLIRMSFRWRQVELMHKEAEILRNNAELQTLRSQIQPHFMLNTLNNIYSLINIDTERAQKAMMSLSVILRQMLYSNDQEDVNLEEEVTFITNYVSLMKLRTSSNVQVDVAINIPQPCRIRVAPLIFNSLIENAFKHGVSPTEHSFVSISLEADERHVTCTTVNSNFPKNRQHDMSGHGIGLNQLQRRLDLLYPGKYEWKKELNENNNTYSSKLTIYDTKLCHN